MLAQLRGELALVAGKADHTTIEKQTEITNTWYRCGVSHIPTALFSLYGVDCGELQEHIDTGQRQRRRQPRAAVCGNGSPSRGRRRIDVHLKIHMVNKSVGCIGRLATHLSVWYKLKLTS